MGLRLRPDQLGVQFSFPTCPRLASNSSAWTSEGTEGTAATSPHGEATILKYLLVTSHHLFNIWVDERY